MSNARKELERKSKGKLIDTIFVLSERITDQDQLIAELEGNAKRQIEGLKNKSRMIEDAEVSAEESKESAQKHREENVGLRAENNVLRWCVKQFTGKE